MKALVKQDFDQVDYLLKDPQNLTAKDKDGWTISMYAIGSQNPALVRKVIKAGVQDWGHVTVYGETPLMVAEFTKNPEIKAMVRRETAAVTPTELTKHDERMKRLKGRFKLPAKKKTPL